MSTADGLGKLKIEGIARADFNNPVQPTAIGLWEDVVSKSPKKTRAHINLGRAYQESGRYDEAIQEFQAAMILSTFPSTPEYQRHTTRQLASMNIAQMLLTTGQFDLAEKLLVGVWNEEPGFPGIATNLSVIYAARGQVQLAFEVIEAGISQLPNYPWYSGDGKLYLNRAILEKQMSRCTEAIADSRTAATLDADLPQEPIACP